jgi:hypothetical protein
MEEVLGLPEGGPSSRGSTFWRRLLGCPREHFLSDVLAWTPVSRTDPLEYGLLWHYLLENLYLEMQRVQRGTYNRDKAPDAYVWDLLAPFGKEVGWEEGYEKITAMLDSYLARWYQRDLNELEIEGIEETLAVGLEDGLGFEWSNRMDLRVIDHSLGDKVRRHLEHKSTWRMDSEVIIGYGMDLQITGQTFLMTRAYGPDTEVPYMGAVVNLTSRPSSTSARAKPPENMRQLVQPSPSDLEAWADAMRFWQRWKATLEKIDDYPRNYGSCVRRYGRCQFFNLCQSRSDDTVPSLRAEDRRIRAGEASHPPGYRYANENDSDE